MPWAMCAKKSNEQKSVEKLLNWRIGPEAGEMGMGKFNLHHYVVDGLICVPSWRAAAYAGPRHLREER